MTSVKIFHRLWPFLRQEVLSSIIGSPFVPIQLRWRILRVLGATIGRCQIFTGTSFAGSFDNITIGEGTFINRRVRFLAADRITLGRGCDIAMDVSFVTTTHSVGSKESRAGRLQASPIFVGDGCWIGAGAVVLPGVHIGPGCVIAAGAVVSRDCAPDGLYGGVPGD